MKRELKVAADGHDTARVHAIREPQSQPCEAITSRLFNRSSTPLMSAHSDCMLLKIPIRSINSSREKEKRAGGRSGTLRQCILKGGAGEGSGRSAVNHGVSIVSR